MQKKPINLVSFFSFVVLTNSVIFSMDPSKFGVDSEIKKPSIQNVSQVFEKSSERSRYDVLGVLEKWQAFKQGRTLSEAPSFISQKYHNDRSVTQSSWYTLPMICAGTFTMTQWLFLVRSECGNKIETFRPAVKAKASRFLGMAIPFSFVYWSLNQIIQNANKAVEQKSVLPTVANPFCDKPNLQDPKQ